MSLSKFLCGKKIFVTGHTGFKGSWLCFVLHKFGADVTGFSLQPEEKSLFQAANVASFVNHNIGDINTVGDLKTQLLLCEPDIVIHLAAQPLVRLSYELPLTTFQTNVMGTANLLHAANECPKKPIVAIITSDKCYENRETNRPYVETDPMGGHDPYSASKGAAELISRSFAKSFYLKNNQSIITLRGGNVIGGGDWSDDRIMTDLVAALRSNERPVLRSPKSIRPWQHILDVISGYLTAIQYASSQENATFEQFNIGPTSTNIASVCELATLVCNNWGNKLRPLYATESADLHEAKILKLDISKARQVLGWQPKYDLKETVSKTVAWYLSHEMGADMFEVTTHQVNDYFLESV